MPDADHRTFALAAAPAVAWLAVAAAAVWWSDGFYLVVAEDRVFEWIQVGGFGVAAVGCAAVAVNLRRLSVAGAVVATFWCAVFVVVVGEEFAWGQRAFGVRVAAVERANDQGDLSLHNIGPGLALANLGSLGVATAGAIGRPAARWWMARRGRQVRPDLLPPRFLTPWFAMAAAYFALRVAWPLPPARVAKFSEVAELTLAVAAAVTAVRLARATAVPPIDHSVAYAGSG